MMTMLNHQIHFPHFQKHSRRSIILCFTNHQCSTPTIFSQSCFLPLKTNHRSRFRRPFRIFVARALTDNDNNENDKNSHVEIEVTEVEEETSDEKNDNTNVKDVDFKKQVLRFQQAVVSLPPIVFLNDNNNIEKVYFKKEVSGLQQAVVSLPPIFFLMRRQSASRFAIGLSILAAILIVAIRGYVIKKSKNKRPGTVADLVRRGQLKSDRRGISSALKYDNPFNNPLVKVGKSNSTVEMCGKVYRLAPVTLTSEQRAIHQKRRSRAYEWKRPTVFLKEGDPVPSDVDPETIRWIPANHPFATTATDLDENLAQSNVYQKHGVPFRIQAEHDALQKKLEGLQNEEKLNNLAIDPSAAQDFGRPFRPQQRSNYAEPNTANGYPKSEFSKSEDATLNRCGNGSISEEDEFPKT